MDLTNFAGQNWLITPAALAVGEHPPANIQMQKWLVVLTGVVNANFEGNSTSHWRNDNLSFLPDMAGPNNSGPLNWAIGQYGIPKPAGQGYKIGLSVDEWAPFVSLSAIYDRAQSIDAGYAINVWRPNHFATGIDALTNAPVGNIFTGVNVDVGVRDTDAWILKLGYNITLRGRIVFTKAPTILFQSNIETTTAGQAPSATQAVGTAGFNGPNVIITPTFPHTGNWLQIGPLSQAGGQFTGNFIQSSAGFGVYKLTAMMFMSSKSTASYLVFNSGSGQNSSFLSLLFADNNQVQDGGLHPTGCTFPRDTPFAIEVTLTVSVTSITAQVGVAETVGSVAVHLNAQPFTSIAFGQQDPGGSGFDVTSILVTYTPQ
jgi:hypothetical protein